MKNFILNADDGHFMHVEAEGYGEAIALALASHDSIRLNKVNVLDPLILRDLKGKRLNLECVEIRSLRIENCDIELNFDTVSMDAMRISGSKVHGRLFRCNVYGGHIKDSYVHSAHSATLKDMELVAVKSFDFKCVEFQGCTLQSMQLYGVRDSKMVECSFDRSMACLVDMRDVVAVQCDPPTKLDFLKKVGYELRPDGLVVYTDMKYKPQQAWPGAQGFPITPNETKEHKVKALVPPEEIMNINIFMTGDTFCGKLKYEE